MNRFFKVFLIALSLILVIGCLVFFRNNLNTSRFIDPTPPSTDPSINQTIAKKLQDAPWQGLRYIRVERTWRFYGVTGETQSLDLVRPVTLIKIYYLDHKDNLRFTWAATQIQLSGQQSLPLVSQPIEEGQLIAVQLKGDYVDQNGVTWEACNSESCSLAQMIDTILVLDDQGTGISNGFIRYGWEPPTSPRYGFLCWQIEPVESPQIFPLALK